MAICIGSLVPISYSAENEIVLDSEAAQPDLEFLEFLGQFETDDGQWIDPGSLLAEEFDDLLNVAENIEQTNDTIISNTGNDTTDTNN